MGKFKVRTIETKHQRDAFKVVKLYDGNDYDKADYIFQTHPLKVGWTIALCSGTNVLKVDDIPAH